MMTYEGVPISVLLRHNAKANNKLPENYFYNSFSIEPCTYEDREEVKTAPFYFYVKDPQ